MAISRLNINRFKSLKKLKRRGLESFFYINNIYNKKSANYAK